MTCWCIPTKVLKNIKNTLRKCFKGYRMVVCNWISINVSLRFVRLSILATLSKQEKAYKWTPRRSRQSRIGSHLSQSEGCRVFSGLLISTDNSFRNMPRLHYQSHLLYERMKHSNGLLRLNRPLYG